MLLCSFCKGCYNWRKLLHIPCHNCLISYVKIGTTAAAAALPAALPAAAPPPPPDARAESIRAVWTSFEVILDVLHTVTNRADVKTKTQALGLKKKTLSLDFVVALMFMKNIAYETKSLVVQLQSVELNILDATGLVHGTLRILQKQWWRQKFSDGGLCSPTGGAIFFFMVRPVKVATLMNMNYI